MKRSKHSLSNYQLTTCDMGQLVPVGWYEALPGDTVQHRVSSLIRVSPLVAPVMHPVSVRFHSFFVPNRLIWNTKIGDSGDFEDFITGGPDGYDTQTVPTIQTTDVEGDVLDHLGLPPVPGIDVSALPLRAYNLVYNEFYRDQDLSTKADLENTVLHNCAWEKDYFTSARPWTQKGANITIPVGDRAPITGLGAENQTYGSPQDVYETGQSGTVNYANAKDISQNTFYAEEDPDNPGFPGVYADLSSVDGVDVNEFRRLFALQRYQEARARYGSRYTEYLRYLGVRPSDARLQRPEYLGGGKQTISFSEVLQTQRSDDGETPQGNMSGHGIAALRTNRYRRFLEEHGIVITLMSVRPKTIYQDGIPRKFLRQDKEDFYQKELEQIGQQEVFNNEIYAVDNDRDVFGYQNRYQEYKQEWSGVSGEFRDLLDYWHLGRKFSSLPALNNDFVKCEPTKRVHAEQTKNVLWCMVNHQIQARRMVRKSSSSRII